MPAISSSAPGKVILCGEHAVVYGQPAIAIPVLDVNTRCVILAKPHKTNDEVIINDTAIRLKCNLLKLNPNNSLRKTISLTLAALSINHLPACEIQIHSSIPVSGGLGSSASVSVALARAVSAFLGHPLENESINDIAFEIEKLHHITPSGIDNSVITYAKPLLYTKGLPIQWLHFNHPMLFLIANSGIKGSTSTAVKQVRDKWENAPQEFDAIFNEVGKITKSILGAFTSGDLPLLGKLMSANHGLLKKMGVSIPQLDRLVTAAIESGAFGAKLTGGGLGGNILALVSPENHQAISKALENAGAVNIIPAHFNLKIEDNA